ncbi:MAG: glutamyl-tRNA reductase [Gemmatimonadales bacterium]|nr:MAG: glutamyl-tRNA reductase [Gemmatimonadales bacterium]
MTDVQTEGLMVVGIDFRSAEVAVRERWAIDDTALTRIFGQAREGSLGELVVIRTCNRTELVLWGPDRSPDRILRLWAHGVDARGTRPDAPVAVLRDGLAARHVLRVAAGLESQILGDIHILGQVRRCYRDSKRAGTVDSHLHRLFASALRTGKRVRSSTRLMSGQSSVGSEAARYLLDQIPAGAPRRIIVVGAGKVGSHAARSLALREDVEVVLLNRTPERARALAGEWNGEWGGLDTLSHHLPRAGGLMVATGAPSAWVDEPVLRARLAGRPFPVIDLSLPRNVDARVAELEGIRLSNLDQVHPEAARVEEARREAIPLAEAIIEEEFGVFDRWLADAGAREALRPLREYVVEVCRKEVSYVAGEEEAAERAARRIAAKLMARPMSALRSAPGSLPSEESPRDILARALMHLFSESDSSSNHPQNPR